MTVSAPVIAAITVLSCCLVITSALLVYKLRPELPRQNRKWSEQISSEPPSPVRKMTVVRGVVVEDNLPKPPRSLLPRWSTLYTSRRTSVVSSHRGRGSFIVSSQVDLEAQLKHDYEKLPEVSIEEYLGFEKARRSRRFGSRGSSIKIPPPLRIHQDSFSSDELRVSPDALSPKSLPVSAPAALPQEGNMKISRKALPAANNSEPIRRHSTPTNMQLKAPQTRGPFNIAFLKAASISALPPSAYSARATPEPSIRYSMPPASDVYIQDTDLKLLSELENMKMELEESRLSRQKSRDLETINEASSNGVEPACPSPVIPLKRAQSKSRSRSRSVPRKIRESSLLQRLGRNRPPPIRLSATNVQDTSLVVKHQSVQQGTWSTPNSEVDDPMLTASVPITPPVMSSNIVSLVPSYPAFVPSSIRQSTATIASSQYSPTFSLASAQRVPLFAGKLKPLGAHSMKPEIPPVPPLPNMAQSAPTTPRRIATGLRKSIKSAAALEVSSFPKPPSSLRSSPLSPTFASQLSPAVKKVHIISPLVNGDHPSEPSADTTQTSTTIPPIPEKSRRPSRYSHLIDKDLPPPPPGSSMTMEVLLEAQQSEVPGPAPKQLQDVQLEPQPQNTSSTQQQQQPKPRSSSSSSTATSNKPLPLPALPNQQPKPPQQDPKPLLPHTRSQSLNSKAPTASPEPLPILSATYYIQDPQQSPPPLLPTSRTVSPITTPPRVHSRANSNSRGASHHRRGRATNATVSPLSEQFPAELKLNLNLAVGSELGLDFGRGMFGN